MIEDKVKEIMQNGSEEDKQVLEQVVNGLIGKQEGKYGSYVGALLCMSRSTDDHSASVTIPNTPAILNTIGIVHGGITATIVDSAMGTLANILAPEGYGAVTSQLNMHYIAPVTGTEITATATVVHKGSQTLVLEGYVKNNKGKKVAHGTATFFIIKKRSH